MTLFIPRKQNITGPIASSFSQSSTGPLQPQMEEALRENFLAIERWANQRGLSVAVANSSNAQTITTSTFFTVTFNSVSWDYYNLTRGSTGLALSENGIWFISAGGQFLNLPASTNLVVDLQLQPGGKSDHTHHNIQGGYDNIGFATVIPVTTATNAPQVVSLRASMQGVIPSTSSPPTFTLWEFSATKLFDIPSRTQ